MQAHESKNDVFHELTLFINRTFVRKLNISSENLIVNIFKNTGSFYFSLQFSDRPEPTADPEWRPEE